MEQISVQEKNQRKKLLDQSINVFASAKKLFEHLEYDNIKTKISDGYDGWSENAPAFLQVPAIQAWIFDYPTAAGSRALMIGVALGIIGTTFRIIMGIEKSFLGE